MKLRDRVILVTGSNMGIGAGIAQRAAQEGAKVVVQGLEAEACTRTADGIREMGGEAVAISGDLTTAEFPQELVGRTLTAFGRLDGLVNCAASSARSTVETSTPDLFDHLMRLNVRAPLHIIQAALPTFRRQGRAHVVNIGSVCAYCGPANLVDYSASKGALMTLTRNLAASLWHDGVRVNQLNIGWTYTEAEHRRCIEDGMPENWPESLRPEQMPFGRMLLPDDIAGACVFLLADEGMMCSGAIIDFCQGPVIGRIGR